jgi:hypothetical protein
LHLNTYNAIHMKIKTNIALSESGFIFNPNTGESFSLNPSGQLLFTMIREGKDFAKIREYFLKHYEVDDSIFEKDFEDFTHLMNAYQMTEPDEQA